MNDLLFELATLSALSILVAGFVVGIVVGLTGMGGGALMTPALIFLGVGDTATVVTADLTAAAVYKTGGAVVHAREGSPNLQLAKWLILGSVPIALLGPHVLAWFTDPEDARRRPQAVRSASRCCSPRRPTRCGSTSTCAGCAPADPPATRTPRSALSPRCSSAPWAACSSASPASAPARSSWSRC